MSNANFNEIVKSAVGEISEADVRVAQAEVAAQIEGRACNARMPFNMIAYENQK